MTGTLRCPRCGEADQLAGKPDRSAGGPEGILVQCLACRYAWPRGVRPCASCGGTDVVDRPQMMTRTPRGNQLAVIGTRTIRLCSRCDAEALHASLAHNQPVPDGYAAHYRHETDTAEGPRPRAGNAAPTANRSPAVPPAPTPPAASTEPAEQPLVPRRPRTRAKPAAPAAPVTLRQAVSQSLEAGVEADPTVVVLLGARLGASTRLSDLDDAQVWEGVTEWMVATWPDPQSQPGRRARQTIAGLLRHWRERGWLTYPAAPPT